MAILFYDHLIDWQRLHDAIAELEVDGDEKHEVIEHAEHIVHTELMIVFVQHLPAHKHEEFLNEFHASPYDQKNLVFLQMYGGDDIEVKVRQKSDEVLTIIINEFLAP
jgi:hypothetical protein